MLAIKGTYDNGKLILNEKAPVDNAEVIVFFNISNVDNSASNDTMSREEALRIFHKYAGSIKADMDAKEERLAYLDERYGNID